MATTNHTVAATATIVLGDTSPDDGGVWCIQVTGIVDAGTSIVPKGWLQFKGSARTVSNAVAVSYFNAIDRGTIKTSSNAIAADGIYYVWGDRLAIALLVTIAAGDIVVIEAATVRA